MQRHLAGAYRIFFNSELENYFEVTARNLAKYAEDQWASKKTCRASLALCSRNNNILSMPQETAQIKDIGYIDAKFVKELELIRKLINNNNGAKSNNILMMFVPLGVDETKIDSSLLSECDSLGSDRGFLAHNSAGSTMYLIDPKTEQDRTKKILELVDGFEEVLEHVK